MTKFAFIIPTIFLSLFYFPDGNDRNNMNTVSDEASKETISSELAVLKPGDLAPDAKVIDADYLSDFNHGVAILQKGDAYAMINSKGEFVLSYTTEFPLQTSNRKGFGLFHVAKVGQANGRIGVMNYKAEFLPALGLAFTVDGKLAKISSPKNSTDKSKHIYVDADFKKYFFEQEWQNASEGVGTFKANGKYGYKNILDQTVVNPVYEYAGTFSEGIAVVGRRDNFGYMKYGFIDVKGKEITPLMFSIKPADFSSGLAQVTPADDSDFAYAFFNRQGKIVIQHTAEDVKKYHGFNAFKNGFTTNGEYVMDASGKIVTEKDFLSSYGINGDKCKLEFAKTDCQGKLVYSEIKVGNGTYATAMYGFIDLEKGKVIEATFVHPNVRLSALKFDPVSKLAYARVVMGKDARGKDKVREGYINEDGVFVIVKAEAGSKW